MATSEPTVQCDDNFGTGPFVKTSLNHRADNTGVPSSDKSQETRNLKGPENLKNHIAQGERVLGPLTLFDWRVPNTRPSTERRPLGD